jgi:ATP-dependent Clp protease ATP-binding subunit ClpA
MIAQLEELKESMLKNKNIALTISDDVINFIVELGHADRSNGAQPIKRVIEEHIKNSIVKCILEYSNVRTIAS